MTNLTNSFGSLYHPQKAFLIYQQDSQNKQVYIESYDIDGQGHPINAHPLSQKEATDLAKALQTNEKKENGFLTPKGLLPKNLLYVRTGKKPCAIWHTPKQRIKILFKDDLGIKSNPANIPALIWKATKTAIAIYAVTTEQDIDSETPLYHAPFFNTYEDGRVCMGNVKLNIQKNCGLEDFIAYWQSGFFNSYFSHMMQGHYPVKGNMVQLWKSLSGTKKQFPEKVLIPLNRTVKHLIQ